MICLCPRDAESFINILLMSHFPSFVLASLLLPPNYSQTASPVTMMNQIFRSPFQEGLFLPPCLAQKQE